MVTYDGLNGNVEYENMIGNDDEYRKLVEIASQHSNLKICNADKFLTITYDDHDVSVNHLAWLQIMGLYETWDIL